MTGSDGQREGNLLDCEGGVRDLDSDRLEVQILTVIALGFVWGGCRLRDPWFTCFQWGSHFALQNIPLGKDRPHQL